MKSKEKYKNLSKEHLLYLTIAIIAYFFYLKSKDSLVNYPIYLNYVSFSLTLLVVFLVQKKVILNGFRMFKNVLFDYSLVLDFLGLFIISFFLSGIILIPFNYLNIYLSKRNDIIYTNCQIEKVTTYSKNRTIFYKFNGQLNVLYTYRPIMEEIKNTNNYNDYVFIAEVREGLLGSYVLEKWDIKRIK